jgi:energy-coupling factor transporter ATP-binding protein EcfA2
LTEESLRQHLLVIGSTGSGKTTLLMDAIQQLLQRPIGLLILDAKEDGLVEEITQMAGEAGRAGDLAILGPSGTHALDLFEPLRSLEDVEMLAGWLMLGAEIGGDNPYWQHATTSLVAAALTLLVSGDSPVRFAEAVDFMRSWFVGLEDFATLPKGVAEVVARAKRGAAKTGACPQLLGALDHVEVWKRLDGRTRSNLQSCLLNVLHPLLSAAATRCFDAAHRPVFSPAQVATEGKLCVVSLNALTRPDLAKFIFRLARRQFFDAAQSRGPGVHPLCGLIADEFPLIVHGSDADQLGTLRSKNCFVLAATQGLSPVDEKIGGRLRRSVLLNFNTIVFLRTREEETGEFAALSLGTQEPPPPVKSEAGWEDRSVATLPQPGQPGEKLVCPPGTLGRLQPHQGYVVQSDGNRTYRPVWFAPWFERAEEAEIRRALRDPHPPFSAPYVCRLMERCGRQPILSVEIVEAAVQLEAAMHARALEEARNFFRGKACLVPDGLEALPASWLSGLPGILWATRRPHWTHLPYMVARVACVQGVLLLSFAQEMKPRDDRVTAWDRLRVIVNCCVYPSRWRPLLRHHRVQLAISRPNLPVNTHATGHDFD